jgi:threonylcarbamoyladenosine tRNA methylthiotransferase MtaB
VRVAIDTHGCRLNQSESDAMTEVLAQAGHTLAAGAHEADVYVLNSCTITHQADADARRAVRRARRENPGVRVVLTGCMANADPAAAAALPEVDAVLGNADKAELAALLRRLRSDTVLGRADERGVSGPRGSREPALISVSALTRRMPFTPLPGAALGRRARALLKVQDGCDHRCAFCIVPSVRGGSRSLPMGEVVDHARRLVESGVPELVLTGVHLGTYGRDLRPRVRLSELVAALVPQLGDARLRLSSVDPHEVDDELLGLMAAHPQTICRHLHLPVQAGDDAVLRRMRRGHTAETFAMLVRRAVARVPGVAIGSDVIVGHPGEDEAAFERGAALLRGLPLAYLHVFSYSPRRGTAAADMPDAAPPRERARRSAELRALSSEWVAARHEAAAGRTADVVVHLRPRGDGMHEGLTDDDLRVELPPDAGAAWAGKRVTVRLSDDGRRVVDGSFVISQTPTQASPLASTVNAQIAHVHVPIPASTPHGA